jgi:hypothetical protein
MIDSEIVQATSDFHSHIRQVVFGVAANILDNPAAFDACDGVFNPDSNSGQLAIGAFLPGGQFAPTRLFFGWRIWRTVGAYP